MKMELSLVRKKIPMTSPPKKGSENNVKTMAFPASSDFDDGAAKAAFHAVPQATAKPAHARLQMESQNVKKAVPKRLSGDSSAATPKIMTMPETTPGIK